MSRLILDSYGWIELFTRGPKCRLFEQKLASGSEILLPEIVLAEVAAKFHAVGRGQECRSVVAGMVQKARLVGISEEVADLAGKILSENKKRGMGLADAVILAIAVKEGATVVTGDPHFKGFSNAEVV